VKRKRVKMMKMKSVVAIVMLAVVAVSTTTTSGVNAQSVGVSRGVTRGSPVARGSSSSSSSSSARTTSRGSLTTKRGGVARSVAAAAAAPTSVKRYEESEEEEEYFSVSTQRLFDADGYQDGEGNECFVDDDGADFFPGDDDFEDPGNADERGQWVKCLPPVFAVVGQAKQTGKNLYPLLQDLYAALRYIHHEMATHVYVDIGIEADDDGEPNSEMLDILNEAILKVGRFEDKRVQSKFLSGLIAQTRAYIQFLIDNKYSELEAPYELGEVEAEDGEEVPNYLKKTIEFGVSEDEPVKVIRGVEVPNVVIKEIRTEMEETDESVLDSLEGFNVCGSDADGFETGGACMWVIDQVKYDALPDDQRDGFHNTQINADVNDLFNERGFLTRRYFTDVPADDRLRLFNNGKKNRINDENGFYVHTHMAYDNDAFLRVYTYQHVAERNYPGQVQKVCFCDWKKLTQVAEQTDCTLDYENNNGCQFEDGENDDDPATIADEFGWLLDPDTGDRVEQNGEYLCCRNCQDSDGNNPQCKDNYEDTLEETNEEEDGGDDDEDDEEDDEE